MFYNKMERLEIVLQIINKLKNFHCTNNRTSILKINSLYKKDFELFNYEMI